MIKLAGLAKNSFVDYPGRIAAVVFAAGCNYDCFFCHNRALIDAGAPPIDIAQVWEMLQRRRGLLDAVVVSGGEPTLQSDGLRAFLFRVRALGYLIKLDTNGSRPEVVEALLGDRLLDYVALDIKLPPARYGELGGAAAWQPVERTLELLRTDNVPFECRTTFVPQLTMDDIAEMADAIAPIPRWALQTYRVPALYKPTDRFRVLAAPHGPQDMKRAAEAAKGCGGEVVVRG